MSSRVIQSNALSLQKHPILFWSLHFLIGCALALHPHWIYLFPIALLALLSKRKLQGWVFLIAGLVFALNKYSMPEAEKLEGRGIFLLESIQPSQSPFQRSFILRGTLKSFKADEKFYSNIPCIIFQNSPPKSGTKWIIRGSLESKERFVLKPDKNIPWEELKNPFSLAHLRFQNKEAVRDYFHKHIKDKRVGHFFASMATGDIDDWLLAMEFRKVGLGHILAISGFHFALIAGLLGIILRSFLPPQPSYLILLGMLLFYFIFLGATPSVLRAFIMIALYVLGLILKRRNDPLNLLGVALLVELILDPLTIEHVGFQLSFLATLGILLFHARISQFLQFLLPARPLAELKKWNLLDQHGYLFTSAIRGALALNLSVLLITLPATLFIFHSFPLLSIPFNLFLTPLLGISLMLLPLGVLLPPLGTLNAAYTGWLLQLIANPPEILNFKFFINSLSFPWVILITALIGALGLTKTEQTS